MRTVFALLVSCFVFLSFGSHEDTIRVDERFKTLCYEQPRWCAIKTPSDDPDDGIIACDCCATSQMIVTGQVSEGHLLDDHWSLTATDGFGISRGDSITLTWGFVQDGTSVTAPSSVASGSAFEDSSLIATLDNNFSETDTSTDLTQRSWFQIFEGTFERFAALSGLTMAYEENDNGRTLNGFGRGTVGVVADIRIGGRSIDGQTGSNTLAFASFPNAGDMVIDTDNTNFFDANDRGFRNVVAHEFGHGLGMSHFISASERFLLEPSIQSSFDGPQHADILALHRGYGDHFEKGAGNDSVANATFLGDLESFAGIGLDGALETVQITDEDFVSIDGLSDTDVYSLEVTQDGDYTLTLTPLGFQYDLAAQGADGSADTSTQVTIDSSELNDLEFELLDQNGTTVLGVADDNGLGVAESLNVSLTQGTYFIEVTGTEDRVQLYSITSSIAQTEIIVSTASAPPTTNLLASQPVGGQQYLVDVARDPGQGQTFSLRNDFTLEAVTVQVGTDIGGAQGTAEDAAALSLNVYQLPLDPVTDTPILTLDSTTLVGSFIDPTAATFDASSSATTPLYLTFDLDPTGTADLGTLSGDTVYAFTITSSSTTDQGFRIERSLADEFANGNGIFTGSNNNPALRAGDDTVFFLQGTGGSLLGDVNCDGLVNFSDIGPFISILSSGAFLDKADVNRDGEVNFSDISPFIAILIAN